MHFGGGCCLLYGERFFEPSEDAQKTMRLFMSELVIPDFFISIFKKLFGERANLVMCLFMFTQTDAGKGLLNEFSSALNTDEGKKLLEEIQAVISKKLKSE
jgi:hypothetical protein